MKGHKISFRQAKEQRVTTEGLKDSKQNIFVGGRMQKSKRRADISSTVSNTVLLCSNNPFYQQLNLDSGDFPRELGDLEAVP